MSAFDYSKFLELAKQLHSLKTEEANRSGISRCYYSMFSKAKIFCGDHRLLSTFELTNKSTSVHGLIIETLKLSDDPDISLIGNMMDTLRTRRNDADYNSYCKDSGTSKHLIDTIEITEQLKQNMKDYP